MTGIFALNGNTKHQQIIDTYIKRLAIDTVVESGTLHGFTTAYFAERVKEVYTVEIQEKSYRMARNLLRQFRNVHQELGASPAYFNTLLPTLDGRKILFYLDAHWFEPWPLFEEMNAIAKHIGKRAVVLIDDFQVPNSRCRFDQYGGVINNFATSEPYFNKIYGERGYVYDYLGGDATQEFIINESELDSDTLPFYLQSYKGKPITITGKIIVYAKE